MITILLYLPTAIHMHSSCFEENQAINIHYYWL